MFRIILMINLMVIYVQSKPTNFEINLGLPSAVKGFIGFSFSPENSGLKYSVFYGEPTETYDAGLGLTYEFQEASTFYLLQGYHWRFGNSTNSPHTFALYNGFGYSWLFSESFSMYSDIAMPIYFNENGTYLKVNEDGFYEENAFELLIGFGVAYHF